MTSACLLLYVMNPNFLLKDEVLYELGIRGITSDADVHTLRKLFPSVAAEDLPVDSNKVSSLGTEELYTIIVSKIFELQDQVTKPKLSLSLSTSRFKTRIAHLKGRLLHLTN